jgi:hypothetical protein
MMLRQEAALDRSIDRKVRILLSLRKGSANPRVAPTGQDDGPTVGNMEEIFGSDIVTETTQGAEAVEELKLNEQYGNLYENKGVAFSGPAQSGNVTENKYSYAQNARMLLKRKGVIGDEELHGTSKRSSTLPVSDDARSVN